MQYNLKGLTRTRKVGGSLIVTLPKKLIEANSVTEGEMIEIEVNKVKKSGFGLLKKVRPFTKEDEFDTQL
jgi:antitoxin component of MazEF toxin-antitoxin module